MQTQSNKKVSLTPAETARLMAALAPVKASTKAKAGSVKANVKAESKPVLLALPKPNKKLKNGVFGGIATELGRMITKPSNKPEKPSDELREQVLNGLGVHGNPIKQVAKQCTGRTSAATIWGAIDTYRAANDGVMPLAATIDAMKLMCIKRGELFESRVKLANIKCELWAYACYYQIGSGKGKPQPAKKGN